MESGAVAGEPRRSSLSRATDKRARILDAAIKVFARTGYHGARVSDIAVEAGIAYGLVYHYFKNKEEILDTIFSERWEGFLGAVEAIADGVGSTRQKLLSLCSLVLGAYRFRPDWVKVLVFEIQRSARFAEPEQRRAVARLFQLVAAILRKGQAAGEVRGEIDPQTACFLFLGSLDLMVTVRVIEEAEGRSATPEPRDEQDLKMAETVVELFLGGVGAQEIRAPETGATP